MQLCVGGVQYVTCQAADQLAGLLKAHMIHCTSSCCLPVLPLVCVCLLPPPPQHHQWALLKCSVPLWGVCYRCISLLLKGCLLMCCWARSNIVYAEPESQELIQYSHTCIYQMYSCEWWSKSIWLNHGLFPVGVLFFHRDTITCACS